ncbi:MAG TPA: outer membrane beta-barrel protein, partial [Spirochaetota bacterium]|nr:outer membrane beta-barrel protein [Spirochaetota bacterium]
MFRFRNHGAKVDSSAEDPRTQKFNELYNTTIASSYSADFFLTTFSLGPRVAWGFYKFVHIQPYAFLLYSTGKFSTMISHDNRDDQYDNTVHGIDYGLGVDIGIFPYFGIFAEYTGGWIKSQFPGGQEYNFDANAIYFGASFRTSYGLLE